MAFLNVIKEDLKTSKHIKMHFQAFRSTTHNQKEDSLDSKSSEPPS